MESLENHFLIAMPSLSDPFFKGSVTYICEHNDEGAMGLIVNLPINLSLDELLEQIEPEPGDVKHATTNLTQQVLSGGPVSTDRGFVLHSPQRGWKSSLALSSEIMITTSKDILLSLGTDKAPKDYFVALGYAGWSPGQLEQEIADNSWLVCPASSELLFDTPIEERWQKATEILGIDVNHLSTDVGHA